MPSEGKTKNFGDGTFVSGSAGYVKHQYNTNKALLDAVSSMVVGMNVQDFLKVAVEKIPAAQKQFSELYGEELLAVKIGRGVMAMYVQSSSKEGEGHYNRRFGVARWPYFQGFAGRSRCYKVAMGESSIGITGTCKWEKAKGSSGCCNEGGRSNSGEVCRFLFEA